MSCDAQELVTDTPRHKGWRRSLTGLHDPGTARLMKRGVFVNRIDENVRIEDQHSFLFHHPVERFAVSNIDPESSAPPSRQRRQSSGLPVSRLPCDKNVPESCFNEGGHGNPTPRRFFPQLFHQRCVYVEGRFHTKSIRALDHDINPRPARMGACQVIRHILSPNQSRVG